MLGDKGGKVSVEGKLSGQPKGRVSSDRKFSRPSKASLNFASS